MTEWVVTVIEETKHPAAPGEPWLTSRSWVTQSSQKANEIAWAKGGHVTRWENEP